MRISLEQARKWNIPLDTPGSIRRPTPMPHHVGRVQRLILPQHTARKNELMLRVSARIRLKQRDRLLILACGLQQGIILASGRRRVGLEIGLTNRGRPPDPDAFWASLLDALVQCGYLLDDSDRAVELATPTFTRGGSKSLVIILEDI